MWQKIVTKAQELIKVAEGLKDKTGPEKKSIVIAELSKTINIPLVPEWIEGLFEPVLYGFIVDIVVKWWNELTGHRLEELPANDETGAAMAEVVVEEVKAAASGAAVEPGDVGEKFEALMAKYGAEGK